jgi:putative ABC transport system substrate-binding protein
VTVEYHLLDGQFDRLPSVMADLVRRRVAVIATPGGNYAAQAAKAATTTIPIVFGVGEDPIRLGLVTSLSRPGGNATGINFFVQEVTAKRLGLLHDLVPTAVHLAVMVNPANVPTYEANAIGLNFARPCSTVHSQNVREYFRKSAAAPRLPILVSAPMAVTMSLRDRAATSAAM